MNAPRALDGKTMIVTGGNTGIGAAITLAAVRAGARVVLDYVVHPDLAAQIEQQAESGGAEAVTTVEADVSKITDLQRLVDTAVERYGRLDVLVNNAGIETRQSLLETTEEDYDKLMAINVKGPYFGSQLAAKQFLAQGGGGVVVNISSVHEDWPMAGNNAYCVSKGGMRMLTRNAAVELGPQGVRFVNVAPGAVDTPINKQTTSDAAKKKALEDSIPLRRIATPEEIADVVVFAASDAARYITGSTIFADGAIMQSGPGL
ncbi:glucose 1-dehydrogenase [Cumulibacter manganitolerans]|uniref:glucose 1-dehydrogenase n=1 Tax=Cumulibacter manganitolerans TaxID=1884992 RepID=UPI0012972057|nr:glucose 1-dehydrogenase [Cumulibacter manganitolerans]